MIRTRPVWRRLASVVVVACLAGLLVGLALPVYFETGAVCALIALASVILLALFFRGELSPVKRWVPFFLVVVMAGLSTTPGKARSTVWVSAQQEANR